jgi:chromosome segregation ATPase
MTPDLFASLLPLVNVAGLGFVGWGLFYLYRTLLDRNKSLESHIKEIRDGHTMVVQIMKTRAEELEHLFEDERRLRANIVEVVGFTDQQQKKLFTLKEEENQQLRLKCDDLNIKLISSQADAKEARTQAWEAKKAEAAKTRLEAEKALLLQKLSTLESRVNSLQGALTRAVPNGSRGAF